MPNRSARGKLWMVILNAGGSGCLQTISIGLALVATLATYFYKNEDRKITEFNGKPVHQQEEIAVIR